jgi:hypothetical protein
MRRLPGAGHEFAFQAPVDPGAIEGVVGRVAGKPDTAAQVFEQRVGLQVEDMEAFANGPDAALPGLIPARAFKLEPPGCLLGRESGATHCDGEALILEEPPEDTLKERNQLLGIEVVLDAGDPRSEVPYDFGEAALCCHACLRGTTGKTGKLSADDRHVSFEPKCN